MNKNYDRKAVLSLLHVNKFLLFFINTRKKFNIGFGVLRQLFQKAGEIYSKTFAVQLHKYIHKIIQL